MRIATVVVLLALAGCADYVWVRQDTTEEQTRADIKECAKARDLTADPIAGEWRFQRCMRGAGYSKAPQR